MLNRGVLEATKILTTHADVAPEASVLELKSQKYLGEESKRGKSAEHIRDFCAPCLGREALPRDISGRVSDAGKTAGFLKDPMRGAGGGAAGDADKDSPEAKKRRHESQRHETHAEQLSDLPCHSASGLGAGNNNS
jgi:hypothetical protein